MSEDFFDRYRARLTSDEDMQALATFAVADAIYHLAGVMHEMAYGDRNDMGALARISVMMEKSADVMAGGMMEVANAIDRHGDS